MDESGSERPTYTSLSAPAPPRAPERPRRAVFPWLLAAIVLAFALGLIANPWFERTVRSRLPGMMRGSDTAAIEARLSEQQRTIAALEQHLTKLQARPAAVVPATPDMTASDPAQALRIDSLVQEVAELRARAEANSQMIDQAVAGATAGAQQARAVLLVATVRRMLDSGQRLGGLDSELRHSFASDPDAVEAVAALGSAPTTPERLRAQFERLRTHADRPAGSGWWDSLQAGLANVVTLRRASASNREANWDTAQARLQAGDVAGAAAIAVRLPGTGPWLADARRYLNGQRALERLETEVLTAPPVIPAPSATDTGSEPTSAL